MSISLIYNIGKLLTQEQGSVERHSFDKHLTFSKDDFSAESNFHGDLLFMKIEDGIHVEMTDLEVTLRMTCSRCVKHFDERINVPFAEREFYEERPHQIEDEEDLYFINKKNKTIDLAEMIRQEIILHFPINPVCSLRCKGLCAQCGKDLNTATCKCNKTKTAEYHKPLAKLKELIK